MSIHVIAQGIVSIRSFSFRKEAEIKKLFFKKFSIGCQVLTSRLLYSSSQTKRGLIIVISKDDFHYRQSHTESELL